MAEAEEAVAAAKTGEVESGLPEKLEKLELDAAAAKVEKPAISFSIWPPSERTRKAIVNRLIENLTTQSPMSKRYGTLPAEEAAVMARQVEEESFTVAGGDKAVDDDGIEVLQVYSKEISKRMLEVLKARASSGADLDKGGLQIEEVASTAAPTEEASSVDNESN
uniref:WPP domain-containing protein n=1 Tax=Kalanchoe fedtschenkoi TaxID=63787 RepID=A0A7N0SXG7_KALFE